MTVSSSELDAMRTAAEDMLLPDTCTITRATTANNAIGEAIASYATVTASAECRLSRAGLRPYMRAIGEQMQTDADWALSLHHDQDVAEQDRVTVGANTYTVVKVWTDQSFNILTRCDLKEVE
jgi:hypothetical protein